MTVKLSAPDPLQDLAALLSPFQIKRLTLRNRFIVPGMQRGISEHGRPNAALARYYGRFARGGFALVISEACAVDHPAAGHECGNIVRLIDATSDAWAHCVESVENEGAFMFIQLWHGGALRSLPDGHGGSLVDTISPSGLVTASQKVGRPMIAADFVSVLAAFVRSAKLAQDCGARGVEIHGCHGSLLDQFLWRSTNRRTDGYGGDDMNNRVRFPAEVVSAIRAAVGPDFIISFRFSQWKQLDYETGQVAACPDELAVMLDHLRKAGVDIFHPSTRRFEQPEWSDSQWGLAGWTKHFTGAPVIAVGGVGGNIDLQSFQSDTPAARHAALAPSGEMIRGSLKRIIARFASGEFDLVAVGRAGIGDPDWVKKVSNGHFDDIRVFQRDDLMSIMANFYKRESQIEED